MTHVRLHHGTTADCSLRGDIALPGTETTQPSAAAMGFDGKAWVAWGNSSSLRIWCYSDPSGWIRYPSGTGFIPTSISSANYTLSADDEVLITSPAFNHPIYRFDPGTATVSTALTVAALRTFVGSTFNGIFVRSWSDGSGGLYASWTDNAGTGAGRDGIYQANSSGVVTAKVYSRVSSTGSDIIGRDVDGHWWETLSTTSLRHTFPDGSTENFAPASMGNPLSTITTSNSPRRGPRCRPLPVVRRRGLGITTGTPLDITLGIR